MATSYTINVQGGGRSIIQPITRTGDSTPNIEIDLPAGIAGTLTTRTDNDTGVVTVASGHGITSSDTVDVYWNGGKRYGVDVTATGSTTISIDIGSGDNLPSTSTEVVIVKQVVANIQIDGDNAKLVAVSYEMAPAAGDGYGCRVTFFDAVNGGGSAVGSGLSLVANAPSVCDITGGATNLYTGNVISSFVASNGSSNYAAKLKIIAEVDATP